MRLISSQKLVIIFLVWLFWGLALTSLIGDSPIIDEQNHLARGYSFLSTGDPRLSIEHPPLMNTWAALPLKLVDGITLPTEQAGWQAREWYSVADHFFWLDGNPVLLMVFLGRVMIVYATLGLALVGFTFAKKLWGSTAGLLCFGALLFDPTIFAHGRYITTDLGGTLFIFLATFAVYNLLQTREKWPVKQLVLAALGIGLAFSAKLTSMVFIPVWIILSLLPFSPQPIGRRVVHLATAGIGALFVVWAIFGFEFGPFLFIDDSMLWLNAYSAPMPTFWSGIERITLISGGGRPSFLLGQHSTDGFLLYFPVALLAKTPIIVLMSFFAAVSLLLTNFSTRRKAIWLMIPIAVYFAFSMTSALNIGYRHLLPILPFIYLMVVGLLSNLKFSWVTPVALILFIIPTVFYHPHQISFFNLIFGGPQNGSTVLVDSNIDWGQDLERLKLWMDENEVESINLAWFGTADPAIYNIAYTPLPGEPRFRHLWWDVPFDRTNPPPGIYAISVTNLREMPLVPEEKTVYAYFRNLEPIAQIGYSIKIYEIK